MDLPPDFKDLLEAFENASVEFILIGGYAVAFHARPRATKDIDLLLLHSPDNLKRAANALQTFGAPASVVAAIQTIKPKEVVYLGQPPLRIDLLCSIDGVDTASLFQRAVEAKIDTRVFKVIALEDLIMNKRAAGRPQDLLDVSLLERIARKKNAEK